LMSIAAVVGGIVLYRVLCRLVNLKQIDNVPVLGKLDGAKLFDRNLILLFRLSGWLTGRISSQRLQPQVLSMLLVMVVFIVALLRWPGLFAQIDWNIDTLVFALVWTIGCVCAVAAAWIAKYHRLAALILVGGTGLVTSLTFLWLSAPDLALTQLVVETVTTVLILLGLRWLPPRLPTEELPEEMVLRISTRARLRRSRDMIVAVASGLLLSAVTYTMLMRPSTASISDFFVLNAKALGGGSNVVNVLLVDFRGFDTMGEVTVLSIVALTVYALLRRFRPAADSVVLPPPQTNTLDYSITQTPAQHAEQGFMRIPAVYLQFLLPFTMLVAAYFFMRGHNLPGGGFVAGLCFSVALITQYMVSGAVWVEAHFRLNAHRWISWGLGIAALTGTGAFVFGYPFLTSHTAHVYLPLFGEVHFPSAFMFDLGVFTVVVGMAALMLIALSHQSVRSHRTPTAAEAAVQADKGGQN
ncbi:MAG TPA: hydrogen gas-evolving membrane-bound hydrogenase subunit E, partial [Pseudohongiella sp.]|nr:hydrogen gas-evolving membrane-bound hydrogenase subunit E [Pseudohongiella sp.]